jgi:hypothetical protein
MQILFTAPHNMNEKRFLRVNNWEEVRAVLLDGASRAGERSRASELAGASAASV